MQSALFLCDICGKCLVAGTYHLQICLKVTLSMGLTDTAMERMLFKTYRYIKISAAAANGGIVCLHLTGHMIVVFLFLSTGCFPGICF